MTFSHSLQNVMILGDFGADSVYVNHDKMKDIRIYTNKDFHWLIGDDVDTTACTSNEYTYDQYVNFHKLHSYNSLLFFFLFVLRKVFMTILFVPAHIIQDYCVW